MARAGATIDHVRGQPSPLDRRVPPRVVRFDEMTLLPEAALRASNPAPTKLPFPIAQTASLLAQTARSNPYTTTHRSGSPSSRRTSPTASRWRR